MGTGKSLAMLPFFARDYIAATRHLSLAERGAYTDLLFFSWEIGPLPVEHGRLARIIGCSPDEFGVVWPAISSKFVATAEGLVNERLEQHRVRAMQLSQKRATAGREGGKRSGESRGSNAQANAKQDRSKTEASASSLLGGLLEAKTNHPSPSPESGVSEDRNSRPRARTSSPQFHLEVIAEYHKALPNLPSVKTWSKTRSRALEARIRERVKAGKPADSIEYWRGFFVEVSKSDFLCGRSSEFRADLEWLLKEANFAKTIEGRYSNRNAANGAGGAHARE